MPVNNTKQFVTSLDTFDPKRLTLTDFDKAKKDATVSRAYLNYNHPSLGKESILMLQTPWIELTVGGGVPKYNEEYHKQEKKRAYIRLPAPEDSQLYKKISALDEIFSSDEFKMKHFKCISKKCRDYKYNDCVKTPEPPKDSNLSPFPPSMKLVFDLAWNEEDPDKCEIITQTFISKLNKDGKRVRTPHSATTVESMDSLLKVGSKVRLIIRPTSGWLLKKKEYGIKWKILKMEVEPSTTGNAMLKSFYEADNFLDSDEEDDVELPQSASKTEHSDNKSVNLSDDSDNDSGNDSDNESETVETKSKNKSNKNDPDDSDNESLKTKSKSKSKNKSKVVDSDNESEAGSDEESDNESEADEESDNEDSKKPAKTSSRSHKTSKESKKPVKASKTTDNSDNDDSDNDSPDIPTRSSRKNKDKKNKKTSHAAKYD